MEPTFTPLHPLFAAEVSGVDLARPLDAATHRAIAEAIDRYAVLVFRGQPLTDDQQVAFAALFGPLENYGSLNSRKRPMRLARPEIADVSNLSTTDTVYGPNSKQRGNNLANQLWHTDSSFKLPPGHLSMLSAHAVPSWGGETQYADMRAAYDDLPAALRERIDDLWSEHSIVYSRALIGFEDFPDHVKAQLPPVQQPLVRRHPGSGRRTLYLAAHAAHIVGMPVPEGRLLLRELMERATQREYVYTHHWRADDLVVWDNRCTMHRGRPFPEDEPRDMRRVTTIDLAAAREHAA